jgi:hypothetical protein
VDPDLGARKLRNFSGKKHFLAIGIFNKNFITKKVSVSGSVLSQSGSTTLVQGIAKFI